MKTAILTIASNENLYLREFVEYYKSIGVDNIILGDNSPINGDFPQLVIGDYIDNGFVKYVNYRGVDDSNWLLGFYNVKIKEYKNEYDWIGVFDVDEYLVFNDPSIKTFQDYLESKPFDRFGQIKVNWRIFNDNDKLYYENKPIRERFPKPAEKCLCTWSGVQSFDENLTTKTIVNCHMDDIIFISPHIAFTKHKDNYISACNGSGNLVDFQQPFVNMDYSLVQLNHYKSLTISEYLYRKLSRNGGKKLVNGAKGSVDLMLKVFWGCNEWTEEKQKIIDDFLKNNGVV